MPTLLTHLVRHASHCLLGWRTSLQIGWWRRASGRGLARLLLLFALGCGNSAHAACPTVDVGLVSVAPDIWLRPARNASPDGWTEPTLVFANQRDIWVIDPGPHRCAGLALKHEIAKLYPHHRTQLINSHAHPQNVLANSAWPRQTAVYALAGVRQQMRNRCRRCIAALRAELGAVWMQGTQIKLPNRVLTPGQQLLLGQSVWQVEAHEHTHTEHDLSLLDNANQRWFPGSLLAWHGIPDLLRSDPENWLRELETSTHAYSDHHWIGMPFAEGARAQRDLTWLYLQALIKELQEGVATGRSPMEYMDLTRFLPNAPQDPHAIRQHQFNVQKWWREFEERAF